MSTHTEAAKVNNSLMAKFRRLRKDESGVTAIEYGLIAGAIAVAIIGAVTLLGTDVKNTFNSVANALPTTTTTTTTN